MTGTDPLELEQVVQQVEEVMAGPLNLLERLHLVVARVSDLEELAEAEDGVERCAQLVAHARQEGALGPVDLHHLLGAQTLGDVAARSPRPLDRRVCRSGSG